jgi:hypothetical protein
MFSFKTESKVIAANAKVRAASVLLEKKVLSRT